MQQILASIITSNASAAYTLTLPTASSVATDMPGYYLSTDWSIINTGTATVTVSATGATGHSTVGNMVVAIGTSGSFRTASITGSNPTAITYRLS